MDLVLLKTSQIKEVRDKLLKEQNSICPICGKVIVDACLDHQHKRRKADMPGSDGAGMVRGVLCRDCNALEGRIWNAMNRCARPETVNDRIAILSALIKYYKTSGTNLVYPGEMPRDKIQKSVFNKLNKFWLTKHKKPLEYPKNGIVTKKIKDALNLWLAEQSKETS